MEQKIWYDALKTERGPYMKKILVRAYCQSNLGDDLFVLHLAKKYPKVRFFLYAVGENQKPFQGAVNVRLPNNWDRIRRKGNHLMHRQDLFDGRGMNASVTIGGSILWEGAPLDFVQPGQPSFLIGANCEKKYSPEFFHQLRAAIEKANGCCFRDSASYEKFSDLPNVSWAPDVLFDYVTGLPAQEGSGIGISVVSQKGVFQKDALRETYYEAIAQLCMRCIEQNVPVRILSFCKSEGDEEAIAAILQKIPRREKIAVSTYRGNSRAFLGEMNTCKTIVATRFHAMILGWVMGKNVVPIVYNSKQTQVLQDCDFRGPMWNTMEREEMTGETLFTFATEEKGRLDISSLKEKSRAQFKALDEYLK